MLRYTKAHTIIRRVRSVALILLAVALGIILVACGSSGSLGTAGGSPAPDRPNAATQTSEGGQITVKATWQGPSAGPVFTVAMDTHTVDLDGYDLRQLAVLRSDAGREARPSGWDAPKGGHHRSGTLTFPATTADGTPLVKPDTRIVELIIRDVGGVPERVFQWPRLMCPR